MEHLGVNLLVLRSQLGSAGIVKFHDVHHAVAALR